MKFTGANIKHGKMRGEWAELRFMARASEQGLRVSKPWGESSPYDFITEHEEKLLRVQVKSTTYSRWNSYICTLRGSQNQRYTDKQIDFISCLHHPKKHLVYFSDCGCFEGAGQRDSLPAHESFKIRTV